MAFVPDFQVVHVGINCADEQQAIACADRFDTLFGLPMNPNKESADARYTGTVIEWLKSPAVAPTATWRWPPLIWLPPGLIWRKRASILMTAAPSTIPMAGPW